MTMPSSISIPDNFTFEKAIELTQTILEQIAEGELSEAEIEESILNLVSSENGARGFFVTYLTDSRPIFDRPSPGIINALRGSPDTISELLVKNIAMSSAMVIHHRRHQDAEMTASSEQVRSRSICLMQTLQIPTIHSIAKQMVESIILGDGPYVNFLEKWGYDSEQQQSIAQYLHPFTKC